MKYFFDSYALIEMLKKNNHYDAFADEELCTSDLNMGEVYHFLLRTRGKQDADYWYERFCGTILSFDTNLVIAAMQFKYQNKGKNFSFVDCVCYALSIHEKLLFLTGDKEFKGMANVEFVK